MNTIAFIGGGNMARSLIGGLLRQGYPSTLVRVSEPNAELRTALATDFGIMAVADNAAAVAGADIWVLAVKPQVMDAVLQPLASIAAGTAPLVISIAAGITRARISGVLGPTAQVVRSMPNTPALIGAGITALCADPALPSDQRRAAEQLLAAAGATVWVDDECLMDAVTALSGSGPAYVFLLLESLIAAGQRQGLPAETARQLALHTAFGAARMAIESSESVSVLRERVTSPGGTTAAALAAFAAGGFDALVDSAVAAATQRGRELAGGS